MPHAKDVRIATALDFARTDEIWIKKWLTKPFYEIWQELNGRSVLPLVTAEKSAYQSIQKVKTFTPPSVADRRPRSAGPGALSASALTPSPPSA